MKYYILYPSVYLIPRDAKKDDQVGQSQISADSTVMIVVYLRHRYSEYWTNPEAVNPARFLEKRQGIIYKTARISFGDGARICMDYPFVLQEGILTLATLMQRYRLQMASVDHIKIRSMGKLRPKNRILIYMEHRL